MFTRHITRPNGVDMSIAKYKLENCSIIRSFSECQGTFKGFFADVKYYRDSDGLIFPANFTYAEYIEYKQQGSSSWSRWRW